MASIQVGRYQVTELLGQGGMGAVYLAEDPILDRQVAVKIIHPKRSTAEAKERFLREARAVARLDSPYIVKIFDIGIQPSDDKEMHYIVMEFVSGQTLTDRTEDKGIPGKNELLDRLRIYWQLLQAVHYAHRHNVVHRDLKPDNVMISKEGRVKIMDFGLAVLDDRHSQTRDDQIMGTMAYFAPEQAKGSAGVDHRADIYALGVILFELCTGNLPFMGSNPMHMMHLVINEPAPRMMASNPIIPKALEDLVQQSMAKDPKQRPPHVGQMIETLEAILRDSFQLKQSKLDDLSPPSFENAVAAVTPPPPVVTPPAAPAPTVPRATFEATQADFMKKFEELRSGLNKKAEVLRDSTSTLPDIRTSPSSGSAPPPSAQEEKPKQPAPYVPFLNPQGTPMVASTGWVTEAHKQPQESVESKLNRLDKDEKEQLKQLIPGDLEQTGKRQTCTQCGSIQPLETRKCMECGHALNASTSYFVIQREALEFIKKAKEAIRDGEFAVAAEAAESALEHDDGLGEAHLYLGRARLELGQIELALMSLQRAAGLLPESAEPYLCLAEVCLARQDMEGVLSCLLDALRRRPTDVESRCRLAFIYSETGHVNEAVEQYKLVLRTHPRHLRANRQLGVLMARLNRDDEAIRYLEQAHQIEPDDPQSITLLGRLYARRRQYPLAQEAFQAALNLRGDDAALRAELGALYQVQNREDLAVAELRKAVEQDNGNREARMRLAGIYEKHGRVDMAVRELEDALKFHPQDLVLHRRLGELYLQKKDLDRAMRHFEDVVKLDPQSAEMHNRLGRIYLKKNYTEQSIEQYKQAVDLHKLAPEFREDLAMAFYAKGDIENSIRELHKAARLDGTNADYIKALGILYFQANNGEEAERHLKWAAKLCPADAQTHGMLGQAYLRRGLTNLAISEYARALELDPNLHVLHLYLARALASAGRHGEAIQSFRALAKLTGKADDFSIVGEAYTDMGRSYLAQNLFAQAEEVFQLACNRNPKDAAAFHGLAQVALHRRKFARAREYLATATKLEPKNTDFVETYASIQGEEGNWGDAVLTIQRALTENPTVPDLYEFLGRALRKAGRLSEAASAYRRASEVFPTKQWRFYWLEGRIEARRERWAEAAVLLRKSLDRNPSVPVYLDLAQAYQQMGQLKDAVELLERATQTVPRSKVDSIRRVKAAYEAELMSER